MMAWKRSPGLLWTCHAGCLMYVVLTLTLLQMVGARYIGIMDRAVPFAAAALLARIVMITCWRLREVAGGKIHCYANPYAPGQLNITRPAARAARTVMALLIVCMAARAQKIELLWPDGAPGALGSEDRDKPSIGIYLPPAEKATAAAVVICPGGGYGNLSMEKEGSKIAGWLNERGIAGFVLKYRLGPRYHHPAPLQDAQQAISHVRAHAAEYRIKADQVGIWGFSAGGHLASTAATHFEADTRPDFLILAYPVITFEPPYVHQGSRRNLLGNEPDPKLVHSLSNQTQVTAQTPPTFLFHTTGDSGVPAENSVLFYLALRKAGVPAEMHIYERGPHGVGLAPADPVLSTWPGRLEDWLKLRGLAK
ncbi:MAG TPA: alpha/beta hydrolase [Bryobacteraceae bacterium]|nr:alpha/beta hydrolase [Bryobacteraceae bacterium]